MSELVITGMRPYDGRYPFDLYEQAFTVREWGWIKRLTGYLPAHDRRRLRAAPTSSCSRSSRSSRCTAPASSKTKDVPEVFERFQAGAFEDDHHHRTRTSRPEEADRRPFAAKLERERQLFWQRFADEFGDLDTSPSSFWDARLGYFSVAPGDIGEMTPVQMLGCTACSTPSTGRAARCLRPGSSSSS